MLRRLISEGPLGKAIKKCSYNDYPCHVQGFEITAIGHNSFMVTKSDRLVATMTASSITFECLNIEDFNDFCREFGVRSFTYEMKLLDWLPRAYPLRLKGDIHNKRYYIHGLYRLFRMTPGTSNIIHVNIDGSPRYNLCLWFHDENLIHECTSFSAEMVMVKLNEVGYNAKLAEIIANSPLLKTIIVLHWDKGCVVEKSQLDLSNLPKFTYLDIGLELLKVFHD